MSDACVSRSSVSSASPRPGVSVAARRILLVEPMARTQQECSRHLAESGLTCGIVNDLKIAERFLATARWDVVLIGPGAVRAALPAGQRGDGDDPPYQPPALVIAIRPEPDTVWTLQRAGWHVDRWIDWDGVDPALSRHVIDAVANVATPPLAHTDQTPVIDYDHLRARCLGDDKLVRKVLDQLASQLPDELVQMRAAIERSDLLEVAREMHKLKGAAANVAAPCLAEILAHIETLAQANRIEEVLQAFPTLCEEVRRFHNAVCEFGRSR